VIISPPKSAHLDIREGMGISHSNERGGRSNKRRKLDFARALLFKLGDSDQEYRVQGIIKEG